MPAKWVLNGFEWAAGIFPADAEPSLEDLTDAGWIELVALDPDIDENGFLYLFPVSEARKMQEWEIEKKDYIDGETSSDRQSRLVFTLKFVPMVFDAPGPEPDGYLHRDEYNNLMNVLRHRYLFLFSDNMGYFNGLHPDWALAVEPVEINTEIGDSGERVVSVKLVSRFWSTRSY